MFAYSLAV